LGKPRGDFKVEPYTGISFKNEEIEHILRERDIGFDKMEDEALMDKVVDQLLDAGVVGWYQGKAEFGPRALGNRSIIVDPRREDAKALLNEKIKKRESFRPFAPSILKEHVSEYFEQVDDVPFMEKVFDIKPEKHTVIPAVTHVNGTGRLQTVDKKVNPRYHRLIEKFYEKTGVPILLNTSFNENEPIVNTPEHALECFLRTKMDMLVSWRNRPNLRGQFFINLYLLRNTIFGINAQTERPIIPQRYEENLLALAEILNKAEEDGIEVLLYIPPIRNDVKIPYNLENYESFKAEVESMTKEYDNVFFKNFEGIVPGPLWGTKEATSFLAKEELDFMHFQFEGHRILFDSLSNALKSLMK
jgi:hypothetical protein